MAKRKLNFNVEIASLKAKNLNMSRAGAAMIGRPHGVKLLVSFWICVFAFWCHAGDVIFVVDLGYDDLGRLASIRHPGSGKTQTYTFNDQVGHKSVSYGTDTVVSDTEYTQGGLAKKIVLHSYAGHSFGYLERTFDVLNRMKSLIFDIFGPRYQESSINYNSWGFVSSFARSGDGLSNSFTFTYGNMGELNETEISGVDDVVYVYDNYGNLIDHNALNGPNFFLPELALGTSPYGSDNQHSNWDYDDTGKLIADDWFTYEYNDIEQVETVADEESGFETAQYLYDGRGERVREVVDDKVIFSVRGMGGEILTQEIHQTQEDGSLAITRKDYVYHNGQVLMTATHHPGGTVTRQYQYRDRRGNPAMIIDEEDGFAERYYCYSAFGHQMLLEENGLVTHEFTGHERDEFTEWDYMHARYYTRAFGRFNMPDPAFDFDRVNPFSFNLYSYCRGNPVSFWDPLGQALRPDEESFDLILQTLPAELRQYVRVNDDGFIDEDLMAKSAGAKNENYQALFEIVMDPRTVEMKMSKECYYLDSEGKKQLIPFKYLYVEGNGGVTGATLVPGKKVVGKTPGDFVTNPMQSTSGNVEVHLNSYVSGNVEKVDAAAHELYLHTLLFLQGRPFMHPPVGPKSINKMESVIRFRTLEQMHE